MLRKIRTTLAILFCFAVALLFLDFSGSIHAWLGWMAKVQFFPAVLALNFIVVAALLLLTFVFGRVYCSVICPLGVFQDAVSWLRGRMRKKDRFRFRFRKEHRLLRYGVLLAFVLAFIFGAGCFAALIEPYSAFGRMVNALAAPLWQWANNGLAAISEHFSSYAFYNKEVWLRSLPLLIVSLLTLVVLVVLAAVVCGLSQHLLTYMCLSPLLHLGLLLGHSKSVGPSAPIAYATSVSPPNEAVAWPGAAFLQITARANPCSRHLWGTLARAVASICAREEPNTGVHTLRTFAADSSCDCFATNR